MNKLPIIRSTPLTKKERNAAMRKADFNEKVEALRKATGKMETRTLSCVCVRTGQHYEVIFERFSENHKFQISRIEKHEKSTAKNISPLNGLFSGSMSESKSFDVNEFDFSGWACPYCGDDRRIHCTACEYVVCGKRMRVLPDGREAYACHDACGNTGTLVPVERISAKSGGSRRSEMGSTKNSPKKDRPRLTGEDNLRLGRPR